MINGRISAELLDSRDGLSAKKNEFVLPEGVIYLDGNSLGPMPRAAQIRSREVVENQWSNDLITSWNKHQWIDLPELVGAKIAPLIGAKPTEVICCDSVSVNLFKLLALGLQLQPGRTKILSQRDNFPTDLYIAQGLQKILSSEQCELIAVDEADIESFLTEDIAILTLTQVNFRSGQVHNIKKLTEKAHQKGILVIWDLAHSAGVMPIELDQWNVDFAVGCGYKYFNGGPGAPAFVFAAERWHSKLNQPLAGWMGHISPFDFSPEYEGAQNIKQFLCGTPSVISMAVLDAALDVYRDLSIDDVRCKALQLADFFAFQVSQSNELDDLVLISPTKHELRGSQLAYQHSYAYAICQALIAHGVIADFREPNLLRFGFSPLFLTFSEIEQSVSILRKIMSEKEYLKEEFNRRQKVT
ncbi:MAG: kynureninase [Gammaproteobacteria bacterium]|nr:kynureninase [Gammaproteobacteria bacterium]